MNQHQRHLDDLIDYLIIHLNNGDKESQIRFQNLDSIFDLQFHGYQEITEMKPHVSGALFETV